MADLEADLTQQISFKRHRFPPDAIRYAVWLYFRFTLSLRDVEELLAERGIDASREAIARASRVNSSITHSIRNFRPSWVRSSTKS